MAKIGTRIDESGMLVQAGDQLVFRRELGGRWMIDGTPAAHQVLGQRGRLIGTLVDAETVTIERFFAEA